MHSIGSISVDGSVFYPGQNSSDFAEMQYFQLPTLTPQSQFTFTMSSSSQYQVILLQLYFTGCDAGTPPTSPPSLPPTEVACPNQNIYDPLHLPVMGSCTPQNLLPPLEPGICYNNGQGVTPSLNMWYPSKIEPLYYLNISFDRPYAPTGIAVMQLGDGVHVAGNVTVANETFSLLTNTDKLQYFTFSDILASQQDFLVTFDAATQYGVQLAQVYLTGCSI